MNNQDQTKTESGGAVASSALLGRVSIPVFDAKTQKPEDGCTVIIEGGIAFFTCGEWRSAVGHDFGRTIQWEVKWWTPLLHGSERPNDKLTHGATP